MPWIESHIELVGHPKTRRLAKLLEISDRDAIGLLHMLWYWALKYAADGDLRGFEDDEIAAAVQWEGESSEVLASLKAAKFVDSDGWLHDWDEYTGKLIERREANAERMRIARAKREGKTLSVPPLNGVRDTFIARAEHVRECAELPDQPYIPTGPDQPYIPAADAAPPAMDTTSQEKSEHEDHAAAVSGKSARSLFEHYRERVQPEARVFPRKTIEARLKSFSAAEVTLAIDHFAADEWQKQHNHTRGAPWFFATDERIEHHLHTLPNQESAHGASRGNHRSTTNEQPSEELDALSQLG